MHIRRLLACLAAATCLMQVPAARASLLHERYSNPDFGTPAGIGGHVFNFFHHSCGSNLLGHGLATGLQNLGYSLHPRIGVTYWNENNDTDYRHWYKRFQRELGIESGGVYYRYEGPDAVGEPTWSTAIPNGEFMLHWYEHQDVWMDIIMFKPCYPGSAVSALDTVCAGGPGNNGYGTVLSGTPRADNGVSNFTYLNSSTSVSASYAATYWSLGAWSGSGASLAQLKVAYRGMLNIFHEHPDLLFIAMQAPPMVNLTPEQAAGCREFARWMREDWLHQWDPTGTDQFQDYPLPNVVPFDFHNSVAWTGDDPVLDGDYFWFLQGGWPDETLDTTDSEELGENAGAADHPESWLNQRTATIFCGGTDTFAPPHMPGPPPARSYGCWIHAVVNLWEGGAVPTPTPGTPEVPAAGGPGLAGLAAVLGLLLAGPAGLRRRAR